MQTDFTSVVILGVLTSGIVQFIKNRFGTDSNKTKLVLVAISLILGGAYFFIQSNEYLLQVVISIVGIASAIYSLFIKK